jgi:hypothetical protein
MPDALRKNIDLVEAAREMSHAAHRWRDRAAQYHARASAMPLLKRRNKRWTFTSIRAERLFTAATAAKKEKERYYALKEQAIVTLHQLDRLRYLGCSPDGMAVYSYAEDEKACLHSCLHPRGVERPRVEGHPEVLLIAAKRRRVSLCDAEAAIKALSPEPMLQYERITPSWQRPQRTCYECGALGHIALDCPEREESDPRNRMTWEELVAGGHV